MKVIDVFEILDRGIDNEKNLSESEWPVFIVSYLESISDMEGWDHFFTYSMNWYPALSQALEMVGDSKSLEVIERYVQNFKKLGVKFDAKSIDEFLTKVPDEYLESCPDWREEFTELADNRWKHFSNYYESIDVQLKT